MTGEKTKKLVVRWTAVYETTIEVPAWVSPDFKEADDAARRIPIEVPGANVQVDTWEIESIKDLNLDPEKA